jgi:hypothetical protein
MIGIDHPMEMMDRKRVMMTLDLNPISIQTLMAIATTMTTMAVMVEGLLDPEGATPQRILSGELSTSVVCIGFNHGLRRFKTCILA